MDIFVSTKLMWHGDRVRAWQQGANPFPITVELDLVGACNSRCPRCAGGEKRGRLEPNVVRKLLDELASGGVRGITYTGGGEPTLHESLAELLSYTKGLGMDCALITNGLRMTEEQIDSTIRNCIWTRVSLDAGGPDSYGYTHGGTPEEFEQVVTTIGSLVHAKKRLGSECTVGVGYLIDDHTIPDMEQAAKLCAALKTDYLQFRPYYMSGWFDGPATIDFISYRYAYWQAHKLQTDAFKVLQSKPKFDKIEKGNIQRSYKECHGQQFCGVVTAMGDVALCCVLRGQERFNLGNIHRSSFTEIWNSERRRYVVANLNIARDCPPLCRCDNLNELLKQMKHEPTHINFL